MIIYTIGHSTHPIDEFIALLAAHDVEQLVDVRTVPGSRHNPQFGQAALQSSLEAHDIHYLYMKNLGGLRHGPKESINMGWHNTSFRHYADYMQTDEFSEAIEELITTSKNHVTAIMCAEAVPWRCHRSLIGDALLVRGFEVKDIMTSQKATDHTMTKFAKVDGKTITYPDDTPKR